MATLSCALAVRASAQTPPPSGPARPIVVPPVQVQGQEEVLRAYQACVAAHRREVDLHNAAHAIIDIRNNRERLERAMAADPQAKERAPGGVDGVLANAFTQYKAMGGPAASIAEVSEISTPCPPPALGLHRREPTGTSSAITARRELAVQPGTLPPAAHPKEPPRPFVPAASPPLRKELEEAWLAYLLAIRSGKESALQETMSSYYYATTRNNYARMGRALTPENVIALGRYLPDLNITRYLTALENRPTAILVHAQDSAETNSGDKPRVQQFFLRFVNEGRGWKVDSVAIVHALKYRDDGSLAPFNLPANSNPEFRADGRIRTPPGPIPVAR